MFKCHLYTDIRIKYLKRYYWAQPYLVKIYGIDANNVVFLAGELTRIIFQS